MPSLLDMPVDLLDSFARFIPSNAGALVCTCRPLCDRLLARRTYMEPAARYAQSTKEGRERLDNQDLVPI